MLIDPDGRKIVPRNMTPEEESQFKIATSTLSNKSIV